MSTSNRWTRWMALRPTDFAGWLILSWIVAYAECGIWMTALIFRTVNGVLPAWYTLFPEYVVTAVWIAMIPIGFRYFRWRGMWVLIGLPITAYWPALVAISESQCRGLIPCWPW